MAAGEDPLPSRRLPLARPLPAPGGGAAQIGSTRGTRGNVLFYLATPPDFFGDIVEQLGRTGLTTETDEAWRRVDHREAVRRQLRVGPRAERPPAQGADRRADLPDRPLPGQGDRAEPAGLPLRQRDLRAHLEPPLHRQRPDHGRGDGGRGAARPLLRPRGRAAGHGAEPPLPAPGPHRDGAALVLSRPRRCGTRRSRCCGRCSPSPPRRC